MPQERSSTIRITVGEDTYRAELNDTSTARAILEALPIEASSNRWGDEVYFQIAVHRPAEPDARAEFDPGELGYWPPGNAFCIFFGPTPASAGPQPMMASPGTPGRPYSRRRRAIEVERPRRHGEDRAHRRLRLYDSRALSLPLPCVGIAQLLCGHGNPCFGVTSSGKRCSLATMPCWSYMLELNGRRSKRLGISTVIHSIALSR